MVKQSSFPGLEQLSQGSEPEHRQWIGYLYPSEGGGNGIQISNPPQITTV
jgi:hypothetical protein